MNIKSICAILISMIFFSVFSHFEASAQSSVHGAHSQNIQPVSKVTYRSGYFEDSGSGWHEHYEGGQIRFPFMEMSRSQDAIYLRNDSLNVKIELNISNNEIWAEWPGTSRHMMHKITHVDFKPVHPPALPKPPAPPIQPVQPSEPQSPPSPPSPPSGGINFSAIEYTGGTLQPLGESQWGDHRTNSDAVHIYDELSKGPGALYLYSDTSRRLYHVDISSQTLYMAADGGPMNNHAAITSMSGVSANPPMIPVLPGTMPSEEREACIASGGKVERAGMMNYERCTRLYSDGGTPCSDSSSCQGDCRETGSVTGSDTVIGICQYDDNPFGCHSEVKNGQAQPGLCVD